MLRPIPILFIFLALLANPLPIQAATVINGVEVLTEVEELTDPTHSAVIVVDMQNEWVSTQGGVVRDDREAPPDISKHEIVPSYAEQVKRMQRFLKAVRKKGIPVLYCEMILHDKSGRLLRTAAECWSNRNSPTWTPHIVEGTWGLQTVKELAPQRGEVLVRKIHGDAFAGTLLEDELRKHSVKNLILTGTATGGCVWATCLGALERGYYPVWVRDCVDRNDEEFALMEGKFPFFNSEEIIETWGETKDGGGEPEKEELELE